MNIVITGVTGNLGRNILYEFIKLNRDNISDLKFFVIGRATDAHELKERVRKNLFEEGTLYLNFDIFLYFDSLFKFITVDLGDPKSFFQDNDVNLLKSYKIDYFIHVASLTDFRSTLSVKERLEKTNVNGSEKILDLIKVLEVREIVYISSAYASGLLSGKISPQMFSLEREFRNSYEETKLRAEHLFYNFGRSYKTVVKIFRPSTICGRLLEKPEGYMSKFDVFYSWAAFFLRIKHKEIGVSGKHLYGSKFTIPIRIFCNKKSGLNIVPVDYISKAICCILAKYKESGIFYTTNTEETSHREYFQWLLDAMNIEGVKFVDTLPVDMNHYEVFYYKTVGQIFTPYISTERTDYDISNISKILEESGLVCPKINRQNFQVLVNYAKDNSFGLLLK